MFVFVNTDGGVIDNRSVDPPGLASCAYVVRDGSTYIGSRSETFDGTNNDAEYRGVILALEDLGIYKGIEGAIIRCDSELIVRQILGVYRCKDPRMRKYLKQVKELINGLPFHCVFVNIPREENKEADWLCTHALYRGPKTERFTEIPEKVSRESLKRASRKSAEKISET